MMRGVFFTFVIYLISTWLCQGSAQIQNPASPMEGDFELDEIQARVGRGLKLLEDLINTNNGQATIASIIGPDERVVVEDTEMFPYSAVVQFSYFCPTVGYTLICSGAMISPRTVLTSAHCVYDREYSEGEYCSKFFVTPGLQSSVAPFGSTGATPLAPEAWRKGKFPDYLESDYALLLLDEDMGTKTGWFTVAVDCDTTFYKEIVTCGYPGDMGGLTQVYSKCEGNLDACQRSGASGSFIHQCDTFGGQSGSPIWVVDSTNSRVIRAVHSRGTHDTIRFPYNRAIYISDQALQWIQANTK